MIDELVKVATALKDSNIPTYDWHPGLKTIPKATAKKPCFRIWLSRGGHVVDVEKLPDDLIVRLWKYEPNNGSSLPGLNLAPLTKLKGEKFSEEMLADRQQLFSEQNDNWAKTRKKLQKCFGEICFRKLKDCCSAELLPNETLAVFFEAVENLNIDVFQRELGDTLARKSRAGIESNATFLPLLAKTSAGDSVSVFLDVKEYNNYPVASKMTMKRMNDLLWSSYVPVEAEYEDAYDQDSKGLKDLYPQVMLPILGGVKLRSQVAEIPSQRRYGFCESQTFPSGFETRKSIKAALEWLAPRTGERDGETYGVAGDKELLFAYPRVLPKDKIPIAKMFGAQPDESLKEDKFERLAESVIEQLKGLGTSIADAELEIFSLRKMDKARTKVVYYRNATVELLERASGMWREGCQNIPPLDVRCWSEKKDEKTGKSYPVAVESATVFPVKLHRYLNTVWKRNGDQAGKVKIFEPADGLRLLLEGQCSAQAAHMMERFIQHAQGYFLSLCCGTGKREIAKLPDKTYYPGILGLLLFKSGKGKDEYMNENAVLLGRFLRIADEIHRLYCEVVRKKDLPPELCGSSMLVGMMESPGRTLDQLAMRSAPYVKWACAYHGDEKGGLVHYWMQHWAKVADPLLEQGWPKRLTPEERAQVFLGYLASFPKHEKSHGDKQVNTDSNKGERQ